MCYNPLVAFLRLSNIHPNKQTVHFLSLVLLIRADFITQFTKMQEFSTMHFLSRGLNSSLNSEILERSRRVSRENLEFSVAHPGISPTGITSNYSAWLQKLIAPPMKLIFMGPEKAALSIISASLEKVDRTKWTAPRFFEIWGKPKKYKLPKAKKEEREKIAPEILRLTEELMK